jgi:hypothetical protein
MYPPPVATVTSRLTVARCLANFQDGKKCQGTTLVVPQSRKKSSGL